MSLENFFCNKFLHEISTGADSYNRTVVLENQQLALCGYRFRTSAKITFVKADVILRLPHFVHENRLRLLSNLLLSILYRQNSTRRYIQQAVPFTKTDKPIGNIKFLPFITECSPSQKRIYFPPLLPRPEGFTQHSKPAMTFVFRLDSSLQRKRFGRNEAKLNSIPCFHSTVNII